MTANLRETVVMSREVLVRGLNAAADVMQNTAAVAKSETWKTDYRVAMNEYRVAATLIEAGAKFVVKGK